MKKRNRFNKHRNWAKAAMKKNPDTRNSDWLLLFQVLADNGVYLSGISKKQILESGVNFHTLLRERQRIQSNGELLPTDYEVLKRRRLLEKEYTEHYSKN